MTVSIKTLGLVIQASNNVRLWIACFSSSILHPLNLEKHFEIYRLYNSASNHHQIIWHAKDADGRAQGVDCLSTLIPF